MNRGGYLWQYDKQRDFYYIKKYNDDFDRDEAMIAKEFETKIQQRQSYGNQVHDLEVGESQDGMIQKNSQSSLKMKKKAGETPHP